MMVTAEYADLKIRPPGAYGSGRSAAQFCHKEVGAARGSGRRDYLRKRRTRRLMQEDSRKRNRR